MSRDCIFCKIIAGEIPSEFVYEDEQCVAFKDINPQAPTHILVIPKEHISSMAETEEQHKETLGHLLLKTAEIASKQGLAENGVFGYYKNNDFTRFYHDLLKEGMNLEEYHNVQISYIDVLKIKATVLPQMINNPTIAITNSV